MYPVSHIEVMRLAFVISEWLYSLFLQLFSLNVFTLLCIKSTIKVVAVVVVVSASNCALNDVILSETLMKKPFQPETSSSDCFKLVFSARLKRGNAFEASM